MALCNLLLVLCFSLPTLSFSTTATTPPAFSVTLHTRSSVLRNHHADWESILAGDQIRYRSLVYRLDVARNRSKLKPFSRTHSTVNPEYVSSPLTSGLPHGSGDVTAPQTSLEFAGEPPTTFTTTDTSAFSTVTFYPHWESILARDDFRPHSTVNPEYVTSPLTSGLAHGSGDVTAPQTVSPSQKVPSLESAGEPPITATTTDSSAFSTVTFYPRWESILARDDFRPHSTVNPEYVSSSVTSGLPHGLRDVTAPQTVSPSKEVPSLESAGEPPITATTTGHQSHRQSRRSLPPPTDHWSRQRTRTMHPDPRV